MPRRLSSNMLSVFLAISLSPLCQQKLLHPQEMKTRLLVSGRNPECSDCLLRFMEQ